VSELGLVPLDEAMAIYARRDLASLRRKAVSLAADGVDPHQKSRGREVSLPDLFRERLQGTTYLERCLDAATALPPALNQQIISLSNKALAAEPADPRDLEAVRHTFDKVRSLLDIGLEFLSAGSVELGADILQTTHVQRILECGHNVVLGVTDQARRIFGRPEVRAAMTLRDDVAFSLLGPADRGLVHGLLHPRPTYTAPGATYGRAFANLAEVGEAAARLALLAFEVTALYGVLKVTHDQVAKMAFGQGVHPPVEFVTLGTLLRTSLVLSALGDSHVLRPVSPTEIAPLAPFSAAALTNAGHRLLGGSSALNDDTKHVADIWIRKAAARLEDELGGLHAASLKRGEITPEMLGSVLLLRR
jgi:hypothetical protein